MKRKSISFFLFIITMNISAQDSIPPVLKSSDNEQKKNEIYINTAPVIKNLFNAESNTTRFSATYKRYLNERTALRFSIIADKINDRNFHRDGIILLDSNNVLVKKQNTIPQYMNPYVNIGFEKLFGNHKLKWFYGGDLSVGYSKRKYKEQDIPLSIDSANNTVVELYPILVSETKMKAFSIGISPFFGIKYPLSKRFSISAQVGVDLKYENAQITKTEASKTQTTHASMFDFGTNSGFLNDISLVYKF